MVTPGTDKTQTNKQQQTENIVHRKEEHCCELILMKDHVCPSLVKHFQSFHISFHLCQGPLFCCLNTMIIALSSTEPGAAADSSPFLKVSFQRTQLLIEQDPCTENIRKKYVKETNNNSVTRASTRQGEQMFKRSIFEILPGLLHSQILPGLLHSHLLYTFNHHEHLNCFMQLYNRKAAQVLAFS